MNNLQAPLTGDWVAGFTSDDACEMRDSIAEKMARIAEIIAANRHGLTSAALAEVDLLVRLAGLEADSTAGDVHADLNAAWGVRFVANEVEAQALAASAIDRARGL